VRKFVSDRTVVSIAGCPPITDVVAATIIHHLTFGRMPAWTARPSTVRLRGPIHDRCQRRANATLGSSAAATGRVLAEHAGMVSLCTAIGGSRVVDLLPGDQLPRIC
jgi:Ni,Fe-hydrogenase I small subunit